MSFAFTEDQQLLADSADRFLADKYGFDARRAAMTGETGWSRDTWRALAEMGWLALPLPEAHGGLGGSTVDTAILMERFGRHLVVEPYLAAIALGAPFLGSTEGGVFTEVIQQGQDRRHIMQDTRLTIQPESYGVTHSHFPSASTIGRIAVGRY